MEESWTQTNMPSQCVVDKLVQAPAKANLRDVLGGCPVHPLPPTTPTLTLLPVVRSEHMRTLFYSIQSQESKSEVCTHLRGNAH